jgi:hypothetical protein
MAVDDLPNLDRVGRRIVPEDIARAVAVEIADAGRLPTRRMCANIDAAGPVAVRDLPDFRIAIGWVVPERATPF